MLIAVVRPRRAVMLDGRRGFAQCVSIDGKTYMLHPDKTPADARRIVDAFNTGVKL